MKLTRQKILICLVCAVFLAFVVLLVATREQHEERVDFLMDTFVQQQLTGKKAVETGEEVYNQLKAFEDAFSLYNAQSDINRINAAAGKSYVPVSELVYTLLRRSQELSGASYQSFDFTIAPVTMLWHNAKEAGQPPSSAQIAQRLALVDYTQVLFNDVESSVMLAKEGMAIDVGGIAKGYACDLARQIYQNADISTALISVGGNVYTYRTPRRKESYLVGIRDPLGGESDALLSVRITEKVLATSGAYERFFEYNGVSYHHIIDKKTGMPAQSDLLSATVICKDGTLADFLSTTFYVLGKQAVDEALRIEAQSAARGEQPPFELIAIDRDKNIYISSSLRPFVELLPEKADEYRFADVPT